MTTYNFTVTSTDAASLTGSRAYALNINGPTVTMTPTTLLNPIEGIAYSKTFAGAGGTSPYQWYVSSGSLPSQLSLDAVTGVLSGTITPASGTFTFTITGMDALEHTVSQSFTITPAQAFAGTFSPSSINFYNGLAVSGATVSVTGGTAPYTYALYSGALPAGTSLNGTTGAISGTPSDATGTAYTFQIVATDAAGKCAVSAAFTGTVLPQVLGATSPLGGMHLSTTSLTNYFYGVYWTGSKWVITGSDTTGFAAWNSSDLSSWTRYSQGSSPSSFAGTCKAHGVLFNGAIYAAFETQVYKSTDNGQTWSSSGLPSTAGSQIHALRVVNGNLVLCSVGAQSKYTTNGTTWSSLGNSNTVLDIAFGAGKYVVVITSGRQYATTLGGTWTSCTGGTASDTTTMTSIVFANGKFCHAGYSSASPVTVLVTSSDGVTFTNHSQFTSSLSSAGVCTDGTNMYLVVGSRLWVSSDGGVVFTDTGVTLPSYGGTLHYMNGHIISTLAGGGMPTFTAIGPSAPLRVSGTLPALASSGTVVSVSMVAANGTSPYTWSQAGTTVGGLTVNASTGVYGGTTSTTAGQKKFLIIATDVNGKTGSLAFTPTVS